LDLVFDSFFSQKSSNAEFESSSCCGQKDKDIVNVKDDKLNPTETKSIDQNTKTNFSHVHSQDLNSIQKLSDYRKFKQTSSSLIYTDLSKAFDNNALHIKRLNTSSIEKKTIGKILKENDKVRFLSQNLTTLNEVQINSLFRKRILTNKEKKRNNTEIIDLTNEFENENFA
jgi:hypothetical protein